MNSGVLTSLLLPHLSSSLTDSLASLNLLCHKKKNDAGFMQDARKGLWRLPYVSVTFFPSLKQNCIVYHSSNVSSRPDWISKIHQLWQSGFSRVYSTSCCSCSFEPKIIKIGPSSHKMYSNNIGNFQESTTILNACTEKCGSLVNSQRIYIYIYIERESKRQKWWENRTLSFVFKRKILLSTNFNLRSLSEWKFLENFRKIVLVLRLDILRKNQ